MISAGLFWRSKSGAIPACRNYYDPFPTVYMQYQFCPDGGLKSRRYARCADLLVPSDHKPLRATCKYINGVIAPLFFSSIILDVHYARRNKSVTYLETLTTGKSTWSPLARTLTILRLSPALELKPWQHDGERWHGDIDRSGEPEIELLRYRIPVLLKSAVLSTANLQSVSWRLRDSDDDLSLLLISDILGSIPSLDTLDLDSRLMSLHLRVFSHRAFMSIEVSLTSYGVYLDATIIPHLRFLRSLTFRRDVTRIPQVQMVANQIVKSYPQLNGLSSTDQEIWDTFRCEGIHLEAVSVDRIEDGLLSYLASYSGLRRLIDNAGADSETASNRLADIFFQSALVPHVQSLVALSCPASFEADGALGRTTLGEYNETVVSFPSVKPSPDTEIYRLHQHEFLEMIAQLPCLRNAEIRAANSEMIGVGPACCRAWHKEKKKLRLQCAILGPRPPHPSQKSKQETTSISSRGKGKSQATMRSNLSSFWY
ncbi:hypothetical protein B0H13DRAFT_2457281 [Mycena leptocephala]|nr:hypothetical protein B0H13DRAFT_2457281 [Mycena leptocephala]